MGANMNDLFTDDGEFIYEPLDQYQKVYKDTQHQNATDYIDDLINKSGVNIEDNRETNRQIKKKQIESDNFAKLISKQNGLRGFYIFLIVLSIAAMAYGLFSMITNGVADVLNVVIMVIGLALMITFIVLIVKIVNPKIRNLKLEKGKIDEKISSLKRDAYAQLKPLNELFSFGMNTEIFQKTIPLINLDTLFDSRRLDYLVGKFGLSDQDSNYRSALFVQSGEISGNPFYICRDLVHYMGTKTYTGSITISWTTTSYVNGRMVTNHHTQTLTAQVTKPFPYYYESPYLVYGNEAAPDLSFDRNDSNAENMSEKQIEKEVKREIKKLEKKSERSTMKGQDYTTMANSEFEVLFGAHNRDNEVQFRLLFTPLAQKQLLALIKDKTIGFGDDFDFKKRKMINLVYPEHLKNIVLKPHPSFFQGYDIDAIKENFVAYNDSYFKHIYFAFAPVLSIPLYQHHKPHEYIYKDYYPSYASFYEHEQVANQMNRAEFIHPLSKTRNILKTSIVSSGEYCDHLKVTAYGFRTEERVEYINVYGRDGRYHAVPVYWTEYLPVEQDTYVDINVPKTDEATSPAEAFKAMFEKLQNGEYDSKEMYRVGVLLAVINKKLQ
jgi:hypothetical protein